MSGRSRRRVLAGLSGVAALLAGCTTGGRPGSDETTETPSTTRSAATTTATTTPGAETNITTTGGTSTRTTSTRRTRVDETRTEHAVIENRTDGERRVTLQVYRRDESLVRGTFHVPPNTGLELSREFEWADYRVRARLDDGDWVERAWSPGSCASTPHPSGNVNVGAVVGDEGLEIVHNSCDYLKLGEHYVGEYEPADRYRVSTGTTVDGTETETARTTDSG